MDSPIEVSLEDTLMTNQNNQQEKIELFKKLEFKQLLGDLDQTVGKAESEEDF